MVFELCNVSYVMLLALLKICNVSKQMYCVLVMQ